MIYKYARLILVLLSSCLAAAQSSPSETPLQIIQKYWGFEVQGARLTPEGRDKVANFFEDRPPRAVGSRRFLVISNTWNIAESKEEGGSDRAVFYVAFTQFGEIREDLRFIRSPNRMPDGIWVKETDARFVMVLTDRHWEFAKDGPREIRGKKEWLIRSDGGVVIVSLDTAIRYVSDVQNRSTNEAVRKHAANTLLILKRLKDSERAIGR